MRVEQHTKIKIIKDEDNIFSQDEKLEELANQFFDTIPSYRIISTQYVYKNGNSIIVIEYTV